MAATHKRRKKGEVRLESTTSDPTNFLDTLVNSTLTTKALVYKILAQRGPYTAKQLVDECQKLGKVNTSYFSVLAAIRALKSIDVIVKVNGGYAIQNWEEIGETPHASDCPIWVGETCSCITGKTID